MEDALLNKECSVCRETKPLSAFSMTGKWYLGKCKICIAAYLKRMHTEKRTERLAKRKEHYEENKERLLQEKKDAYKLNAEEIKRKVKEYRDTNADKVHAAAKDRYEADPDKFRERMRQHRKDNPEKHEEYGKKYAEANPKKRKVLGDVYRALKYGKITKGPCEVCGDPNSQGHHCDYDKPLDVMWLCQQHHTDWHSEHGEGLNPHYLEAHEKIRPTC